MHGLLWMHQRKQIYTYTSPNVRQIIRKQSKNWSKLLNRYRSDECVEEGRQLAGAVPMDYCCCNNSFSRLQETPLLQAQNPLFLIFCFFFRSTLDWQFPYIASKEEGVAADSHVFPL